eukprot:gene7951-10789_t
MGGIESRFMGSGSGSGWNSKDLVSVAPQNHSSITPKRPILVSTNSSSATSTNTSISLSATRSNRTAPFPANVADERSEHHSMRSLVKDQEEEEDSKYLNILNVALHNNESEDIDFSKTESQNRISNMADCELECSEITEYLYVSGYYVAASWDTIQKYGITRIVNCCSSVVDNHFENKPNMKYLTLNMVDGRQDDILWFAFDVIQFILDGMRNGEKILIHCEKGISRSCSFAIAFLMWKLGKSFHEVIKFVKFRRNVCSPNLYFLCQLNEFGQMVTGDLMERSLIFRLAFHLPHDTKTPVLKLCIENSVISRKPIVPSFSMLDPNGIFIIKPPRSESRTIYVWRGKNVSNEAFTAAQKLCYSFNDIIHNVENVVVVDDGKEKYTFSRYILRDGPFNPATSKIIYDDHYDYRTRIHDQSISTEYKINVRGSNGRTADVGSIRDSNFNPGEKIPIKFSHNSRVNNKDNEDNSVRNSSSRVSSIRLPEAKVDNKPEISNRAIRVNEIIAKSEENPTSISIRRTTIPNSQSSTIENENHIIKRFKSNGDNSEESISRPSLVTEISLLTATAKDSTDDEDDYDNMMVRAPSKTSINDSTPHKSNGNSTSNRPNSASYTTPKSKNSYNSRSTVTIDSSLSNDDKISFTLNSTSLLITSNGSNKINNINNEDIIINSASGLNLKLPSFPTESEPVHTGRSSDRPKSSGRSSDRSSFPALGMGKLERTPSLEKHSIYIGLPRGPTPIEDLSPGITNSLIKKDISTASLPKEKIEELQEENDDDENQNLPTKPTLYQVVSSAHIKKRDRESSSTKYKFEWQAMGIYDDDDLTDSAVLLLITPSKEYFLWLGSEVDFSQFGIIDDGINDDIPSSLELVQWMNGIGNGDINQLLLPDCKFSLKTVVIEKSGIESDSFWDYFNEGF